MRRYIWTRRGRRSGPAGPLGGFRGGRQGPECPAGRDSARGLCADCHDDRSLHAGRGAAGHADHCRAGDRGAAAQAGAALRCWGCPGLPAPHGGRRADTAPSAIGWWCPSGHRFPLPGSRFGPASSWGPWPCLAVWPSGWPWGSFSGGTAGRSVQTAVTIPWAGTSAGTGSPSSCKPAVLPGSSSVFGGRSTWRCF